MQKNYSIHDSIDDIIGFLNENNKSFKDHVLKDPDSTKLALEKSILEEQYDSLSEFQMTYEDENKKKKDQYQLNQNFSNENLMPKVFMPNDSFANPSVNNNILMKIRYLQFKPLTDDPLHCASKNPQDFGYYFKFLNNGEIKLIKYLLEDNGFLETSHNNWTILWSVGPIKNEIYNSLSPYQKVNHFPKSYEITRKDYMHRNISKMQAIHGFKNFNFVPKTFILPTDHAQLKEDSEKKSTRLYIVKPAASSQGRGIYLTDNIIDILQKQNNNMIVCHYIDDPFLINGFKFDLRIYVLITSINPLRVYMYQEGLVRFATVKYDPTDFTSKANRYIHLTNYSVNKNNENFVANTNSDQDNTGSKWSLTALKSYFQSQSINMDIIIERIEEILVKTILSIENTTYSAFDTQVPYRNNCFELLGFDILLDSHLKPWLLEVNLSPSLNLDSPLDQRIKGELIADIFTITGIMPKDLRLYQNLCYNKNFHLFGQQAGSNLNVSNEKKNDWNSSWNSNLEKEKEALNKELTKEERQVLKETDEEYQRRRNFKRIYPDQNALRYKTYFESQRPFNELLIRNKKNK